ncbi:hypothetical protein SAMN04489761_4689 [Tenacibaculum sp. MAR_2009_124]|uniref:hypothetical protein n=1 Tax=Tenacibaculum sp. MAR_2009_124 TaxID=1250059 RepID=UPI00089B7E47|nr:hypothetical protein [Tenacibaculum sp. MAR_2009_124]SED22600.1 hypothetical protein SAMN04489761_4689 [Tenacibaculum sp. MAR_2009_124]
MDGTEKLYNYLTSELPNQVDFKDLYNFCFSLFCTLDILPEKLRSLKITTDVLALTVMKISKSKNIREYSNKSDWIEQIEGFLKFENNYPNHENARILLETN